MAVSSTATYQPNGDQIIKEALRLVGKIGAGEEPLGKDKDLARDILQRKVKGYQAQGLIARTVEATTLTLTDGTATYTAASGTLEILFPLTVYDSSDNSESTVEEMSGEAYMEISNKTNDITGIPSRAWVQKTSSDTVTITLDPIPSSDVNTLRYRRVRLLRDMDSSTVTLDLETRWVNAVVYDLAHDLSLVFGYPSTQVAYFRGLSTEALAEVRGKEWFGGDVQFYVSEW